MHKYNQLTFSTVVSDVISKYAENNALSFIDEKPVTYTQMGNKINALIAFIEKLNINQGDKVIIYSQNMPNWGIVYFTLQWMGVIAVPVLPDFNTHELENVIRHSESKAIFISESLESKLVDIQKENIKTIIRINNFDIIHNDNINVSYDENAKSTKTYITNENDLAILLYTSGTTGDSKGVMLSQKNVIFNALQGGEVQKIFENEKFLSVLPLSHTYENTLGLILPILKGACIYYLRKPPTASVLIPAMQSIKPDMMLTVPLIIEKVYKNSILPKLQSKTITRTLIKFKPTRKFIHRIAGKKLYQTFGGNLKFFGIGGAKIDAIVEQFLIDAKFPYAIGYGLTETSPLLAGSNPTSTKFQAIGPVVKKCKIKINNPDPITGEGEIWAKGPNVMLGYYKNKTKTNEVMTNDGWFKTGDLGILDKKGYLSHKGRLKNMIVGANGENIYPEEIESLINNFKHVIESVVVKKKGKLVALVHFNRDELEQKVKEKTAEITHIIDKKIEELALELKHYINNKVNKFSKIQLLIIHPEPFHKTATKKIKRYLYY